MRGRYHFVEFPQMCDLDGDASVVDHAIEEAKRRSKGRVHGIGVMDHSSSPAVLRGVARNGAWRWMETCPTCKGSGQVKKGGIVKACDRCTFGWRVAA